MELEICVFNRIGEFLFSEICMSVAVCGAFGLEQWAIESQIGEMRIFSMGVSVCVWIFTPQIDADYRIQTQENMEYSHENAIEKKCFNYRIDRWY